MEKAGREGGGRETRGMKQDLVLDLNHSFLNWVIFNLNRPQFSHL